MHNNRVPSPKHATVRRFVCCLAGSDTKSICNSCTCALVDVYRPALVAGGVTFNPNDPSTFPLDKVAGIIRACSEQYVVSMLMANINVTALAALSSCTFTPDTVPRYGRHTFQLGVDGCHTHVAPLRYCFYHLGRTQCVATCLLPALVEPHSICPASLQLDTTAKLFTQMSASK